MKKLLFLLLLTSCSTPASTLEIELLTPICIEPFHDYLYKTCNDIAVSIDGQRYDIPAEFETDLASIPRIAWPILSPANASLIAPAIVHDWFYKKTCDFDREQTDLIFYTMLLDNGLSRFEAGTLYYAVRLFGSKFYNEDYCENTQGMDQKT